MRIGILTFRSVYNYGAILQAYALKEAIARLGGEPEFINYIRPNYRYPWWYPLGLRDGVLFRLMPMRWRFGLFRRRHLPATRPYYFRNQLEGIANRYDVIIVGSDQVWNSRCYGAFDPTYFLDFVPPASAHMVSYAACCGQNEQLPEMTANAGPLLRRFDAISVRDSQSREIVKTLGGRDAEVVVDPTLLHDFAEFGDPASSDDGYILVYALGRAFNRLGEFVALTARQELGLPVFTLWPSVGFRVVDRRILSAGPIEMLRWIRGARLICTNSFHGVALAIKFERPFVAWLGSRPDRVFDLLTRCGAVNRLITDQDDDWVRTVTKSHPDYATIATFLKPELRRSEAFLRRIFQSRLLATVQSGRSRGAP
jgi:hypothetical protein